jgi:hypothetical protein
VILLAKTPTRFNKAGLAPLILGELTLNETLFRQKGGMVFCFISSHSSKDGLAPLILGELMLNETLFRQKGGMVFCFVSSHSSKA